MDGNTPEVSMNSERIDASSITNPDRRAVAKSWIAQRNLNRVCYSLIPDLTINPAEGFPIPLENLTKQIKVHDNLLKCLGEGALVFGKHYNELQLEGLSKEQLLQMLDDIDGRIIQELATSEEGKIVTVPWRKIKDQATGEFKSAPVSVAEAASSLRDNEVYHIQLNRAMLRHLGIQEPEEFRSMWG